MQMNVRAHMKVAEPILRKIFLLKDYQIVD